MSFMGKRILRAVSVLSLPFSLTGFALAAPDEAPIQLEEIIVTATKRASLLQETPIAITAITGSTLQEMGAKGMDDFFRTVPGLVVQEGETGAGRGRVAVRGIRSQGEATLGLYYGETPIIGSNGTASDPGGRTGDLALFDVRQIEVLRGPQGTLYGSSSMGGTIRVLFNEPSTRGVASSVSSEGSFTRDGGFNYALQAMLNTPLTETLALRAVVSRQENEGYIDQVTLNRKNTNDSRQTSVRAALKWAPREDFSYTLTVMHQDSGVDDSTLYTRSLGMFNSNAPTLTSYDEKFTLVSGEGRLDLGFADLVLASGWQESGTERTTDGTATALASIAAPASPCRIHFGISTACSATQLASYVAYARTRTPALFYAEMENRVITQEARLTSNGQGALQWTAGLYYEKRNDDVDSYFVLADATTGELIKPIDVTSYRYVDTDMTQVAPFGEATLEVLPGLKVTGGLRYYHYEKTVAGEVVLPGGPSYQSASPYAETKTTESGTIGKASLSYQATDDVLLYSTASQGFRPGGTNNTPNIPSDLITYESDSLWNYEAGIKTNWFDKVLSANLAGYWIDWDNIQVSTRTADNVFSFITNAGAARTRGVEFELNARPVTGLTLSATVNYTDAKLTEDQVNSSSLPSTSIGRAGDRIPYTPRWSGSASASYEWELSASLSGLARLDYSYTGQYPNTFRPTLSTYRVIGGYHIVGGRLGVKAEGWNAALFARNLFNSQASTFTDGSTRYVAVRPRTIGVSVGADF